MSLKSTFLAFKESGTSCPNCGEGGGGNLDKIQKTVNFFFVNLPFVLLKCWISDNIPISLLDNNSGHCRLRKRRNHRAQTAHTVTVHTDFERCTLVSPNNGSFPSAFRQPRHPPPAQPPKISLDMFSHTSPHRAFVVSEYEPTKHTQ